MINHLHARFHRPEKGWDPIPAAYANRYSQIQWEHGADEALLDEVDRWVGGLAGKRVLDLGGGPGHYSVAFAKRDAIVTWYDISRRYLAIARARAAEKGLDIRFSLGYMDHAIALGERFDVVFNRICWYYCFSDRSFAKVLFGLLEPGGIGYVDTPNSIQSSSKARPALRIRTWLNDRFSVKVGHPMPPRGRIARLFMEQDISTLLIDYTRTSHDRVIFQKRVTE